MPRLTRLGAGLGSDVGLVVGFGSDVVLGARVAGAVLAAGLPALGFDARARAGLPAVAIGAALGAAEAVDGTFDATGTGST
jgi:hypothetical protein